MDTRAILARATRRPVSRPINDAKNALHDYSTFPIVIEIGKVSKDRHEQHQLLTRQRYPGPNYRKWESSTEAPQGHAASQASGAVRGGVGSFLLPKVTVETPTISREFLIRRV